MSKNVEVLSVTIDKETQTAKIELTPASEQYIMRMFPDMSMQDAVQAYWDLASKHLDNTAALRV